MIQVEDSVTTKLHNLNTSILTDIFQDKLGFGRIATFFLPNLYLYLNRFMLKRLPIEHLYCDEK